MYVCVYECINASYGHRVIGLQGRMFPAGRMVFWFFPGSHGTLVAVSAPFMLPLRDSDIPINVPFTFRNKQPHISRV